MFITENNFISICHQSIQRETVHVLYKLVICIYHVWLFLYGFSRFFSKPTTTLLNYSTVYIHL